MKKLSLSTCIVVLLALLFAQSSSVSAKDFTAVKTGDDAISVVYHGKMMSKSDLLKVRKGTTYCATLITSSAVKRAAWDGRLDQLACFDTETEAKTEVTNGFNTIKLFRPSAASASSPKPNAQSSCNDPQANAYSGPVYIGPYGAVCASNRENYLGGNWNINSVSVNGDGASICIKENYFPPNYTLVDYDTIWVHFIYVAWYNFQSCSP